MRTPSRKNPHRPSGNPVSAASRRAIASRAARLMAEDGINDFHFAKRKAARQLGLPETKDLPSNAEVEEELRLHQSLYQGEELAERLLLLRHHALEVMRELERFDPQLTGSVLEGTAGRAAVIEIEVFPEDEKELEWQLLARGHPFRHVTPRRPDGPLTYIELDWDGLPVTLSVFPPVARRISRPRAGLAGLATLLSGES